MTILVIVESPGKLKKISSFLGKDYDVQASVGIFRDMDPKKMSIDFDNNYEPIYVITKPDVVKNLKASMKKADMVYLATDLDREGEGIAQSLVDVLKPKKYKRIVFNAITKQAILDAIKNAGDINEDLVDAQKARRVLDRYAGYSISPLLQKQIGGKLSAGRVQSVAVKIVIDRENEINDFIKKNKDATFFRVSGLFSDLKSVLHKLEKDADVYQGDIAKIPFQEDHKDILKFMNKCKESVFKVHSVTDKIRTQGASPPFTTSTLQQDANKRFGFSVDGTMKIAQKLYEGGYITYMRTDSVEISEEGHADIKEVILDNYGKDYYSRNVYKNKVANSQEAHEAIRPTHPELIKIEKEIDDESQIKLYKLIWQRTIASQMKPAKINVTTIQINISKSKDYYFHSVVEKIVFLGYLKVYKEIEEQENNSGKIPKVGKELVMQEIIAKQEYLRPPPRYTEASLVKRLEDLGIGRPSTFANTIKTIMQREYVKIGDVPGIEKDITNFYIKDNEIIEDPQTIHLGSDKKKIIPTDLGITVNKYLVKNFSKIMDYGFTANLEQQLDKVSNGKKKWYKVIDDFYHELQPIVDELSSAGKQSNEKLLGVDKEGNEIYTDMTKYGPVVKKKIGNKFAYSKLRDPLTIDNVTVKDAVKLFAYPKLIGKYEGHDVCLQKGQFGFYLVYNKNKIGIPDEYEDKEKINLEDAIKLIKVKQSNNLGEMIIKEGSKEIKVLILDGKFGPYLQVQRGFKKTNYKIPDNMDPNSLSEDQIKEIMAKKFSKKVASGGKYTKGAKDVKEEKSNKSTKSVKYVKNGSKKSAKKN